MSYVPEKPGRQLHNNALFTGADWEKGPAKCKR